MTIRKLSRQREDAVLRGAVKILRQLEQDDPPDLRYVSDLFELLEKNTLLDHAVLDILESCRLQLKDSDSEMRKVIYSDARYALMKLTGEQVGDWDFLQGCEASGERRELPLFVYADRVRSPFNIGSVFRTAESFGVKKIFIHPSGASPNHPRSRRSAMGCIDRIPWEYAYEDQIPNPVFALETGGASIEDFSFPKSATVVIGSEELGVSPKMLEAADRSLGRVTIPTCGSKYSLNVSVSFGILLHRWFRSLTYTQPGEKPGCDL